MLKNVQMQNLLMPDSDPVLSSLPIGLVSQFPLDYLHLVCLGVMRRFLLCCVNTIAGCEN